MRRYFAIVAVAILVSTIDMATAGEIQSRLTPAEIAALPLAENAAGTSGVSTMRTTVLSGDPAKSGLYTIQIVIPPHTTIRAHHHRDDRVATVVSGLWYIGYGTKREASALKELSSGGFYTEPAGASHFAGTGDLPAVVHITGYGPSDTVYVDAANDPTQQKPAGR